MASGNIIGKSIKYYDYLGCERFGTIVAAEPYKDDLAYIYIEDDEIEYNVHFDTINGIPIKYAEIRSSDEVYLDE